jgi:hypothetical protein
VSESCNTTVASGDTSATSRGRDVAAPGRSPRCGSTRRDQVRKAPRIGLGVGQVHQAHPGRVEQGPDQRGLRRPNDEHRIDFAPLQAVHQTQSAGLDQLRVAGVDAVRRQQFQGQLLGTAARPPHCDAFALEVEQLVATAQRAASR